MSGVAYSGPPGSGGGGDPSDWAKVLALVAALMAVLVMLPGGRQGIRTVVDPSDTVDVFVVNQTVDATRPPLATFTCVPISVYARHHGGLFLFAPRVALPFDDLGAVTSGVDTIAVTAQWGQYQIAKRFMVLRLANSTTYSQPLRFAFEADGTGPATCAPGQVYPVPQPADTLPGNYHTGDPTDPSSGIGYSVWGVP